MVVTNCIYKEELEYTKDSDTVKNTTDFMEEFSDLLKWLEQYDFISPYLKSPLFAPLKDLEDWDAEEKVHDTNTPNYTSDHTLHLLKDRSTNANLE